MEILGNILLSRSYIRRSHEHAPPRTLASPDRHLASIHAVKDIAFDSGGRLIDGGNPIGGFFMNSGNSSTAGHLSHSIPSDKPRVTWLKQEAN